VLVRRILRRLPWPVRGRALGLIRRLLTRVPVRHRLRLARWFVPLAPRRRAAGDRPAIRVRTPYGRVTARCDAAASPAGVRRDNLDRVVAALNLAGVDWFRVPARSLTHTAVAVPERERDHVVALLSAVSASPDGRLDVVRVGGRKAADRPDVLRLSWPVADPDGGLVLGPELGCEVEFWRERDGFLLGPRPNPVCDVVALEEPVVSAPEPVFSEFAAAGDTTRYRTREVLTMTSPDRVRFPIDVVYTWVDGSDPAWRKRKAQALGANPWVTGVSEHTANSSRFASRDELRYSLRALHCFAPWVRRVFLVTDGQAPPWLDVDHPNLTVVDHAEIFGDTGRLPTFNSHAIESRLHRIPGLAEHFLYLNDDVFLGRPVSPGLFFTPGGLTRFFPSRALVDSAPHRPHDPPVNAAGKTNRRLIQQAFGRVLTRKMMHTPHPARRSVLAEVADRFADQVEATAAHQFRHPEDVSLLSSLQQYYGYLTGRAVPGDIRYGYADLADPATPFKLARMLHGRHLDAFCLNDTHSDAATAAEQAGMLADFLPAYLPFASPFELASPRTPMVGRQVARALAATATEEIAA
jgi:stealth protein CR2/Stealth-like protein